MNASEKKPLRIVSVSDIHFAHGRVDTYSIAEKFRDVVFPYLKKTDILALVGDITDTSLGFDELSAKIVVSLFIDLFRECEAQNVSIVLLRGTLSHDRNNLKTIRMLHEKGHFKCPLHYADTLSVAHIPEHDLKVAYVPDNLPQKDAAEVIGIIKEQMVQRGWDTLDYAFVHGYFQHVLPKGLPREPHCTFRAEQFDFVTRFVFTGHVHTSSQYLNVLYNGSFDRLAHGEEEDKGFLYAIDNGKDARIEFVKNPFATPFLTFDLSDWAVVDEATVEFQKRMDKLDLSQVHFIRVSHPLLEVRQGLGKYVAKAYPKVHYSHIGPKSLKDVSLSEKTSKLADELPPPTESSLPGMIEDFLTAKGKSLHPDRISYHLDRLTSN